MSIEVDLLQRFFEPVAERILEIFAKNLTSSVKDSKLEKPDRRLSIGVSKEEDKIVYAFLLEKEDGSAQQKALNIKEEFPENVVIKVLGKAYSSKPETTSRKRKPEAVLKPGISIGHNQGYPGTLGALVAYKKKSKQHVGFISASHVLALNNSASVGDHILQPGPPDGERVAANRVGTLENFTYLVHHQGTSNNTYPSNTEDIALAKPDDVDRIPQYNLVPNPKDPNKNMRLKSCIPSSELFEYVGEDVHKVGRTTGFTTGKLDTVRILEYPIQLPDGKVYVYKNLAVVSNIGRVKFSKPGDSGSVVYTGDGKAFGLIVGGSAKYTFLSPLSKCLESIDAELLV